MAVKLSPLAKLLAKIEKVQKKHASDPCYTGGDFYDLDSYSSYIRKELKLKKNSDLYIIDMEEKNYMDFFYETLMQYIGKDVSIQVNQTWVDTCDGEFDIIVLIVTRN